MERFTEAELREIELLDDFAETAFGQRFIAEVRRLRGLLVLAAKSDAGEPWAVLAEMQAIEEELKEK